MSRFESGQLEVFPLGFADVHVHLREPGATDKEDFAYGTRAAIAGGATVVFDMVNNPGRVTNSVDRLEEKENLAARKVHTDIGFHYRFQPEEENIRTFANASRIAFGLKSMLEISTGSDKQTDPAEFRVGWRKWHEVAERTQPIILHTETETIEEALAISAGDIGHPTHVAHVSNRPELEAVIAAKEKGWPVTCGVTLHNLFMDKYDVRDWYQRMKPPLDDPGFLWRHLDSIDVIETDHAPHTADEKKRANIENPAADEHDEVKSYGVPGLEAVVPLLFSTLRATRDKSSPFYGRQLDVATLYRMLAIRPREILGLPTDTRASSIQVQFGEYEFGSDDMYSKCGWSPYTGWLVNAKVVQADIRGSVVYRDGDFSRPEGRVLRSHPRQGW